MTATGTPPPVRKPLSGRRHDRRSGELSPRELLRWTWRQLTSMRTALVLLLLLALAAVPGSVIPQERVDALNAGQWKDQHDTLAPIYDKLGLFNVYGSPWFAAIYLLLVVSLVGCIVPRTFTYLRAIRAQPPAAPRNLSRLPDHASYSTDVSAAVVRERAREVLRTRGYRLRTSEDVGPGDAVSAERGYLREVGNLLFHLAVLVVLVGFAIGSLFGYKGGVILVTGTAFANNLTQYDDFAPGNLFRASQMDPFTFKVENFDVEWLPSGMARGFDAQLTYSESPGAATKAYDLKVNHPLKIGATELFLIGHGYAPVITVRDGEGNVAYSGPTVFLPQGQDFVSFGVVKAPDAQPRQIGLEGLFFPTFVMDDNGDPASLMGDDLNPLLSLNVYTGDLGLDTGESQSVYVLDTSRATPLPGKAGQPLRIDIAPGQTVDLPDGLGSVTFEKVVPWQRIQISQTPGKRIALLGVVLALLGLLGSLFIRSRRVWVRAVADGSGTRVEVATLDRSSAGGGGDVVSEIVSVLQDEPRGTTP